MVYRTNEIAQTCNVTVNTVRNWCKEFGAYLSPGATVTTGHRRFTERDKNVLLYVSQLRNDNLQQSAILQRLSETKFPDIVKPKEESAIEPIQNAVETHSAAQLPLVALDDLRSEFNAKLEAMEQRNRPNIWWFAVGLAAGLGMAAVAELFALVAKR